MSRPALPIRSLHQKHRHDHGIETEDREAHWTKNAELSPYLDWDSCSCHSAQVTIIPAGRPLTFSQLDTNFPSLTTRSTRPAG